MGLGHEDVTLWRRCLTDPRPRCAVKVRVKVDAEMRVVVELLV